MEKFLRKIDKLVLVLITQRLYLLENTKFDDRINSEIIFQDYTMDEETATVHLA